jgi:hypothetical protein
MGCKTTPILTPSWSEICLARRQANPLIASSRGGPVRHAPPIRQVLPDHLNVNDPH